MVVGNRSLQITKTSEAGASFAPGDTINYEITIENTGDAPYTNGSPATVSDSVAVRQPSEGDGALRNVAGTSAPGGICAEGDPDNCRTVSMITPPPPSSTGGPLPGTGAGTVWPWMLAGLVLLTVGGLLVGRSRRRT